jgi:hypothetical protein
VVGLDEVGVVKLHHQLNLKFDQQFDQQYASHSIA